MFLRGQKRPQDLLLRLNDLYFWVTLELTFSKNLSSSSRLSCPNKMGTKADTCFSFGSWLTNSLWIWQGKVSRCLSNSSIHPLSCWQEIMDSFCEGKHFSSITQIARGCRINLRGNNWLDLVRQSLWGFFWVMGTKCCWRKTLPLLDLQSNVKLIWWHFACCKPKNATWRWQWALPVTAIIPYSFPNMDFS